MVYNQRQRMPQQPGWDSPTLNANASGANLRLYYSFEYGECYCHRSTDVMQVGSLFIYLRLHHGRGAAFSTDAWFSSLVIMLA